jgi:corrinoid protein of di/trimethylamine methyltransferase
MSEDTTETFDLESLNDQELTEQVHDDLYNGLKDEIVAATNIFLARGWGPDKVLNDALVEGMRIVGIDFRDGILFVPEVLLAANAMKAGMEILRPLLAETGAEPIGKVVIGTVKGDIHDIGKSVVASMLQANGYDDVDLGIDVEDAEFVRAAQKHQADCVGISTLLTLSIDNMGVVIEKLKDAGMRDQVKVIVGGAPVTQEFADEIGADAFGYDASDAVKKVKELLGK